MTVKDTLRRQEYSTAIMMALKLNENALTREVVENVPHSDSKSKRRYSRKILYSFLESINSNFSLLVTLTVASLPKTYVERLLKFVASELEESRHLHFYLLWIESILTEHGPKGDAVMQLPTLLLMQKNMQRKYDDLSKMLVFKTVTCDISLFIEHVMNYILIVFSFRCDFNQYTISYLTRLSHLKSQKKLKEVQEMMSDNENNDEGMEVE